LNAPVSIAVCVTPNAVVVTFAVVGYVRHAPLVPPGAVGFDGFEELDELLPQAVPASAKASATVSPRIDSLLVSIVASPLNDWRKGPLFLQCAKRREKLSAVENNQSVTIRVM